MIRHSAFARSLAVAMSATLVATTLIAAVPKEDGVVSFPMKYEGGSLPLNQHDKLNTMISKDRVTFFQGKRSFEVFIKTINEVSYGADVHRRVGQAIGVGALTLGLGAMLLLVKTKKHYVGMTWKNPLKAGTAEENGGIVFKVGKGEYRGFLTALEGRTGLKAVNADAIGSGGTSKP